MIIYNIFIQVIKNKTIKQIVNNRLIINLKLNKYITYCANG